MKEYLSNIEPTFYDSVIYVQMVMAYMVGIKDMFSDDILLYDSPEKLGPVKPYDEPPVEKPVKHPLQGEFLMPRAWTNAIKM